MKMPRWGLRFVIFVRTIARRLLRPIRRVVGWDGFWITLMLVVLAVGIFLSWHFWEELHRDEDSLSTTIRNLGLVIGGVVAIVLAFWRSIVSERQADTAQRTLLYERYQKGAEMLGSNVGSVRLGGIYALERLADEHPDQYHVQVMNLFCAFVRDPFGANDSQDEVDGEGEPPHAAAPLREDVSGRHERHRRTSCAAPLT